LQALQGVGQKKGGVPARVQRCEIISFTVFFLGYHAKQNRSLG
jgi:hypothetical protein